MREEKAGDDAFVNDVESSCIVQVFPVRIRSSCARV
jgi:hypothetical protein